MTGSTIHSLTLSTNPRVVWGSSQFFTGSWAHPTPPSPPILVDSTVNFTRLQSTCTSVVHSPHPRSSASFLPAIVLPQSHTLGPPLLFNPFSTIVECKSYHRHSCLKPLSGSSAFIKEKPFSFIGFTSPSQATLRQFPTSSQMPFELVMVPQKTSSFSSSTSLCCDGSGILLPHVSFSKRLLRPQVSVRVTSSSLPRSLWRTADHCLLGIPSIPSPYL